MVLSLSDDQTRLLRCHAQRLYPEERDAAAGVAQVVEEICGVQAQVPRAAALAVRARSSGLHSSDVAHAREQERSVVRTWCMRGTLHLVATEDVGWLLSLLGPLFVGAGRHRLARLGLDDDAAAKGVRAIRDELADDGPSTREELVEGIRRRGVRIAADSQAGYHLVRRAALEGVLCFGPRRCRGLRARLGLGSSRVHWIQGGSADTARAPLPRSLRTGPPRGPRDLVGPRDARGESRVDARG